MNNENQPLFDCSGKELLLMSVTKQRSSAGKSVAIFFIVFIILEALIIFGVSRVFKNKDVTPSIAGYSMYIMDSDAMGDSVPKGSLVVASNGSPSPEGVKKAVLAEEVPGVGTSVFWLADVSTSADLSGVVYTVFQEKDPSKLYELKTQNIVGTATTYYETAGKIITFMTSKFGMIILIAAPLFLMVLLELIIMIVNRARYSGYDDDDDDEEEQPVELDDFLFGGKHDEELINKSVHNGLDAGEGNVDDISFGEPMEVRNAQDLDEPYEEEPEEPIKVYREPEEEQEAEAEPEEPAVVEEPAPKVHEEAPKTASKTVDRSYYEKASRIIDGEPEVTEPEPVKAAPVKEPEPVREPAAPKPAPDMKSVSAGFEDLMKLMEQESNKLKNQLDDK